MPPPAGRRHLFWRRTQSGDKVGIMMPNCREWVMFDQATLGLGLINVPLFYNDRGGNVSYIAADADMRLLFIQGSSGRAWSLFSRNSPA